MQILLAVGHIGLTATLVPRGSAAAVVLNDEQVSSVGEGAKRFPVVATVNGYTWRTTVTRMRGEFLLGLNREVREGAGVNAGDTVELEIGLDTAAREIDVPAALATVLASTTGDAELARRAALLSAVLAPWSISYRMGLLDGRDDRSLPTIG